MKISPNSQRLFIFGYRSIVFRIAIAIIVCIVAAFVDGMTLFATILFSAALNINIIDIKKITVTPDKIHITRYRKPEKFDMTFWLRDLKAANIYERNMTGMDISGSGRRTMYSYYRLHIELQDETAQRIELLGMLWFERAMLKRLLDTLLKNIADLKTRPRRAEQLRLETDKGWTEAILAENCEWTEFYFIADILENDVNVDFTKKVDDFDSAYWNFKYHESDLILHYNVFTGVSIMPEKLAGAAEIDNRRVIEIGNLLLKRS